MFWRVVDNSGIKVARQLKIQKFKRDIGYPGDLMSIFPRKFKYVKAIKRQKYLGLVVFTRQKLRRPSYFIQGYKNGLIILNFQKKFLGSKIFSPVFREVPKRRGSYLYKRIYARTALFL